MNEELLLQNRLRELSKRSESRGIWTYSSFLSLYEQDICLRLRLPGCSLEGGYPGAERRLAVFGSEERCGWVEEPPIVCLKIAPVNAKFADDLSHRDFLGALMSLGIKREVLGDIAIHENCGYLFCLEEIAPFIAAELTSVKHTTVTLSPAAPPAALADPPPVTEVVVASERLDAVIAAVYRLSRAESQAILAEKRVFLSGRLTDSPDTPIPEGTIVSVRHLGRFTYEGIERETRRGRLRVLVRKW